MAKLILSQSYTVAGSFPVEDRLVLTYEQMRTMKESLMPKVYFATCSDDGDLYIYYKVVDDQHKIDPVTGKFHKVNAELAKKIDSIQANISLMKDELTDVQETVESIVTLPLEDIKKITGDI